MVTWIGAVLRFRVTLRDDRLESLRRHTAQDAITCSRIAVESEPCTMELRTRRRWLHLSRFLDTGTRETIFRVLVSDGITVMIIDCLIVPGTHVPAVATTVSHFMRSTHSSTYVITPPQLEPIFTSLAHMSLFGSVDRFTESLLTRQRLRGYLSAHFFFRGGLLVHLQFRDPTRSEGPLRSQSQSSDYSHPRRRTGKTRRIPLSSNTGETPHYGKELRRIPEALKSLPLET